MPLDHSPPVKHPSARLALNADLTDLVAALDAMSAQARRLAGRVPGEFADPDFNDVIVEDLTRLRLNLREAAGAIAPFLIPMEKATDAAPVELVKGAGE
jgi:hypothetical protein